MTSRNSKLLFAIFSSIGIFILLMAPLQLFAAEIIKIGGTGSGLATMKLLAAAFEKSHPGVKIQIVPSLGSSGGIKAAIDGEVTLAISSRPLKDGERQAGAGAIEYARSPFVFATHAKNSKKNITLTELETYYGGTGQFWPNGSRVRLIMRPEGETDTRILRGLSPVMDKAVIAALGRQGMHIAIKDQDNGEALAKTPGSLGGITLTQVMTEKLPLNILSFDGVRPSTANLANGSYHLYKPLYLVTTGKTSTNGRQFAEFICSRNGQKILSAAGNLPQGGVRP